MSIGKSLFPHINSAFRFAQQFFTWLIEWVTRNSSKYLYIVQYSAWLAIKELFLISNSSIVPSYQTCLCGLYTLISEDLAILYLLILTAYALRSSFFLPCFMDEEQHIESQVFLKVLRQSSTKPKKQHLISCHLTSRKIQQPINVLAPGMI